uniref:Uncharacterized protein n=1 Tax=Panagrolaimus sp. ES5 TaxID=591445 RepID=A0AC34F6K1_9BILA
MLKIIIQQRKEFLDKLSSTTESMAEMEEKLKELNKEIETKSRKLEEEQSKNGTILIHLNGLNQKYDQLEHEKASLINKLSISETTVQKWVDSALQDHNEFIEAKAKNEELQQEFEKEKESLKKIMNENAISAEKQINELIEQNKKIDQELEALKKEHQQCSAAAKKDVTKSRKRIHKDFQAGTNLASTSIANPPQLSQQTCNNTSPPELPSLTPPKLHTPGSLQELQNYIFHQQNNLNQSGSNNAIPSNNNSPQPQPHNVNNNPIFMQAIHRPTVTQQEQQPQHQQQVHYLPRPIPNGSMIGGNNQQISSTVPTYCFPVPQNLHQQQQQQLQQQVQQQMQQLLNQSHMQIPSPQINNSQQVQSQLKSNNSHHQQIHQHQQGVQQGHHPQHQNYQQQHQTTVNHQQAPFQQHQQQHQRSPQFIHPSSIGTIPQNMQISPQIHINQISQQRSIQQHQQQIQNNYLNPPASKSVHRSTPSGSQNNQPPQQPLSNDMLTEFNKYFYSLPFDQRNQILNAAGVTIVHPVVEISD